LIIGGVIVSLAIFNGLYPAIQKSSSSINSATSKVSDRIESRIEIIQVGDSGAEIYVWVKNVGTSYIDAIDRSDLFYGPDGNFSRITWGGAGTPRWSYAFEGGYTRWEPAVTCKITITLAAPPAIGTYILKVVIPNGIFDNTTFSVN
jgi:flagellar protein FlaG